MCEDQSPQQFRRRWPLYLFVFLLPVEIDRSYRIFEKKAHKAHKAYNQYHPETRPQNYTYDPCNIHTLKGIPGGEASSEGWERKRVTATKLPRDP